MSTATESAELIRAHARHPIGRTAMPAVEVLGCAELITPTCGDRLEVCVGGASERIELAWTGRGCEVSQGSASLLAEELRGLGTAAARARIDAFLGAMADHRSGGAIDGSLGQEAALLAVAGNPVRSVCATLAWRALRSALDGAGF